MRYKLLTGLLFSVISIATFSQYNYNSYCKDAYSLIQTLKFDSARYYLALEKLENPGNLIPVFLENYIDFLILTIGENKKDFRNLEDNKNTRLDILEDGNEDSPYYLYCMANVNLQWAFARMKFEEYFTAFFEINRAYKQLEENSEKFPGFIPNYIGLGVLHAIVGSVPDNYRWITNILGIHGSIDNGIEGMYMVIDSITDDEEYQHLLSETLFYLSFIELNLSPDKVRSLEIKEIMDEIEIDNPLLTYVKANILLRNGYNDQAITILEQRNLEQDQYPFLYLDFVLGRAKLNRLDADADQYFEKYIKDFNGINYKASACQKLAWFHLIKGDTLNYYQYISHAMNYPDELVDEDKQARYEAKTGRIPNVYLLKARLLFDGGYYEDAVSFLLQHTGEIGMRDLTDSVEYYYRLGRAYDEIEMHDEALEYYNISITKGKDLDAYYAGNAALMSGKIYEQEGNLSNAGHYYELCLDLDFKEYERSIKFKAKGGLNRIRQ